MIEHELLCLISNYIYLICSIILFVYNKILEGLICIIIWYISHNYHCNEDNIYWSNLDEIVASIAVLYVVFCNHRKILCKINIIILILIVPIYIGGRMCYYKKRYIYNILHSIWHILSAIFITKLIL